jgi:hypothetical protein
MVNDFIVAGADRTDPLRARITTAVGRALELDHFERNGTARKILGPQLRQGPVQFTMVNVELKRGPEIVRSRLKEIRDAMNSRGFGLPGERYMICCDEDIYQALINENPQVRLIKAIMAAPMRWTAYARDRHGFGWAYALHEAWDIAQFVGKAQLRGFEALSRYVHENPGQAVLIGVGLIVVSALALWALPALAPEMVAVAEAGVLSTPVMEEAMALELAAAINADVDAALLGAAGVATGTVEAEAASIATMTSVSAGLSQAGAGAQLMRTAGSPMAQAALKSALRVAGVGAPLIGASILIAPQTAFAANGPPRVRHGPLPALPEFKEVIGTRLLRVFLLPKDAPPASIPGFVIPDRPQTRDPNIGDRIDATQFNTYAAEGAARNNVAAVDCRYLGELSIT